MGLADNGWFYSLRSHSAYNVNNGSCLLLASLVSQCHEITATKGLTCSLIHQLDRSQQLASFYVGIENKKSQRLRGGLDHGDPLLSILTQTSAELE